MRFDFSCRRLYGFCSRLCPRQVLGFSALSSASSWIFLAKLAEDLTKNNENQVKSGGVWGGVGSRKHAQSKPRSSKNHPKSLNIEPSPPKNPGQKALERCSKARSYSESLLGGTIPNFWSHFSDFEPSWPPSWPQVGGQDGAKINKKSMQKKMKF